MRDEASEVSGGEAGGKRFQIFYKTSEWSGGKGEAECVNRLPPIFICAHIRAPGVTRQV